MKDWKITSKFKYLVDHIRFKKRVGQEWYLAFRIPGDLQDMRVIHIMLKDGKFIRTLAAFEEVPEELKNEILMWRMGHKS